MAKKKKDFQKDMNKFFDQAKDRFRQFSKDFNVLAKKSEKGLIKASRAGKVQLDIVGLGMQKEKLFYDIGKKVASLRSKKSLALADLEPYWKQLGKIESDTRKKKRELSFVRKEDK